MRLRVLWAVLLFVPSLLAADAGQDLLSAAKKGQTAAVSTLLAKGANIEATDRNGRTPLMLAAQKGHAETVKLLLSKGAKPDARDRDGWTAFGLAVFSTAAGREAVMDLLPRPKPFSVRMESTWTPDNLYSSCFLKPPELAQHIASLRLDETQAAAIREYASTHDKGLIEFVTSEPSAAVLQVEARPGVSCNPKQTTDNVNLAIDVRMLRSRNQALMLEKTFGGGLKGLHARVVNSPAQYAAFLDEWAKSHAGPIYLAVLEAWLRGEQ